MVGQQCPTCGSAIPANRSYCVGCGYRVPAPRTLQSRLSSLGRGEKHAGMLAVASAGASTGSGGGQSSVAAAPKSAPSSSPSETPHRSWKRRVGVAAGLMTLAILALVGFYAVRVNRMFDTIHTVNTPAAEISGAALGGSDGIKIDTGPAKTALAGGVFTHVPDDAAAAAAVTTSTPEPTDPPATMTSTSTDVPATSTSTSLPTATATEVAAKPETVINVQSPITATAATAPSETSTASPSATATAAQTVTAIATPMPSPSVVLSQIERVKNGDFESGADGWYLETGATVGSDNPHGGAADLVLDKSGGFASQSLFFVTGTTYRVEAWAKLSKSSSTPGVIGINYYDANYTQITDSVPTPISIATSDWTQYTFDFTPPDGVATVDIYFWKPTTGAVMQIDDVSVRSIVPESTFHTSKKIQDKSLTILLMGVDARPGEAIDIGVRPDSLMVLHLDPDTGSCRLLSIPRDTRTELPGYGLTKINHALAVGGIEYEKQVVENLLGVSIDHYMLIDFNGFEALVDAVGGITVNVPKGFTADEGITFVPGVQQMTGYQALVYARWRGGSDGDFGRQARQQLILQALVEKASGLNIIRSINELLPAVSDNLRTDLTPSQMAGIATDYRSRCTDATLSLLQLDGSAATYQDPLLQMPLYYIEVDEAEIQRKVAALMEP